MNLFKGKIYCLKCGKRYNGKPEGKSYNYICSSYKNYHTCTRNVIHEDFLINIVLKHLKHQGRVNVPIDTISLIVERIEANNSTILIRYVDGSVSEINDTEIIF